MNNRGVTLVEMIVSMLIALLVTVAVLQFFLFATKLYREQQIQNEQLTIIEGVEEMITTYLRYADTAAVSGSGGTAPSGWLSLYTENGGLFHSSNPSVPLAGGDLGLGQMVEVVFRPDGDDVLMATIRVYDSDGHESTQTIHCRLLNLTINGNTITVNMGSDGSAVYYS